MNVIFDVPFECPTSIRPHLEKTLAGEYDVPVSFTAPPTIIDCGANCGAFSVWAAHKWPDAQIYAYEPHPKTFELLKENTRDYRRIKIFPWGIGDAGMRVLNDGTNNCGEMSFYRMRTNDRFTGIHCEVRDPLTLPTADILKIDTEGCEVEILRPLIEAGRRFNIVLLEWHSEELRRQVDSLLSEHHLFASTVEHPVGRGVSKYIHRDIHRAMFP